MYEIIFYEKKNGESEIWNFLEKLLQNNGTRLPENITKHIDENIWELRPGSNRIFYFCCNNNQFILLHSFRKKTQKTPRREIEKAKSERDDYLSRKETN